MHLTEALLELCSQEQFPIIAIDGPAGAGKTTIAEDLYLALSLSKSTAIIHMDDLYNGWDHALDEDFVEVLSEIVRCFKDSKPLMVRKYDWFKSEFGEIQEIAPSQILILEGVGAGSLEIQNQLTALIWMEIEPELGLSRVLARDGEIVANQMQKWLSTQQQYFSQHSPREKADFILST